MADRRRRRPRRRGAARRAPKDASRKDGPRKDGGRKDGPRPEKPRSYTAAPDRRKDRIDPDNPFAAALMGLRDKT
jgi:ATP-dependent RNA helicase SUPV3L1/SUV3